MAEKAKLKFRGGGMVIRLSVFSIFIYFVGLSHAKSMIQTGFSSDVKKTFSIARQEKKPVMIDFFGIWCPPCNDLDETVFESAAFLQKAKAFKLLKVDADAKESWKLKDDYKVGGYPTVVFTNFAGKEIFRVVGYLSPSEFIKAMDLALSAKGKDLEKSCKSPDLEDEWRCAVICAERKNTKCATEAFTKLGSKLEPGSPRFEEARNYFLETSESSDLKRDGYERTLTEFNLSPKSVVWIMDYIDFMMRETDTAAKIKKPILERYLGRVAEIAADPRLEEFGVTKVDVLESKASVLEILEKTDEAKKAWTEVAATLATEASQLAAASPGRGIALERIHALNHSGDVVGALALANEYRNRFPNEFTFHFLAASILLNEKKYPEAIEVARKAYEHSYGDNRIRVANLLIKLYGAVADKVAAGKIYEEIKKTIKPEANLQTRTSDYLKKLDDTWAAFPKN